MRGDDAEARQSEPAQVLGIRDLRQAQQAPYPRRIIASLAPMRIAGVIEGRTAAGQLKCRNCRPIGSGLKHSDAPAPADQSHLAALQQILRSHVIDPEQVLSTHVDHAQPVGGACGRNHGVRFGERELQAMGPPAGPDYLSSSFASSVCVPVAHINFTPLSAAFLCRVYFAASLLLLLPRPH